MEPPIRFRFGLGGVKIISSVLAGLAERLLWFNYIRACSNPCTMDSMAALVVLNMVNMVLSFM
jgi:hypothetical protein